MAHVGDSGAFVVRGGVARRLTQDHKPTNPAEKRRIAEAGGRVSRTPSPLPHRHVSLCQFCHCS